MTDQERAEVVAAELRKLGYTSAYDEHTGGGIFCVFVPDERFPGQEWIFGMANDNWGGHRMDMDNGAAVEGTDVETGVPSWATGHASLSQVARDIDRILRNL